MNVKIGRNDPCPCNSGKKFKKCCLTKSKTYVQLGEHEKRMLGINSVVMPPPGTEEYNMIMDLFKKTDNECRKKELEKRYKIATTKINGYLYNGADLICDKTIRYFYLEYSSRLFKAGFWSFPTSFNVVEAFLTYIPEFNFFKLKDEYDFIFSFDDYMDFVTSDRCIDKLDLALDYFEEGKIYHFNNADDPRKLTVKNNLSIDYGFAGVSIIRHADELNIVMVLGEITDMNKADKIVNENYLEYETYKNPNPAKENIAPSDAYKLEAVKLGGIDGLWQTIVLTRFDLSKRTQHVRYILKDHGNNFSVITDDPTVFPKEIDCNKDMIMKNMFSELINNAVLFELCKISLYLPYYFEIKSDSLINERHPTNLKSKLTSDQIKEYIELKDKLFYRNVSVVKGNINSSPIIRTMKAPEMKIESSGYWKQLYPGQKGIDKSGNVIHGKTWVEKHLSWVESDKDESLSIFHNEGRKVFDTEQTGYLYILRSAAHSKDIFKIGLTTRTPETRADELSRTTGSPDKFLVANSWLVKDCYLAEKLIHNNLEEYRISSKREFFKIPYKELLNKIQDILKEAGL